MLNIIYKVYGKKNNTKISSIYYWLFVCITSLFSLMMLYNILINVFFQPNYKDALMAFISFLISFVFILLFRMFYKIISKICNWK